MTQVTVDDGLEGKHERGIPERYRKYMRHVKDNALASIMFDKHRRGVAQAAGPPPQPNDIASRVF